MPDLAGLAEADAHAALTAAGLAAGAVTQAASATVRAGLVVSQTPAAGTRVSPGATVDFVVSSGPPVVSVPSVIGMTQAAAQVALAGAGLALGAVGQAASASVAAGLVISQVPAAGSMAGPGSPVDVIVSSGPPLPPDPVAVAPPVDATVAGSILSATSFLYTGPDPIQTGVAPGTIELRRAAVVRGRVIDRAGSAVSGVTVRVFGHPELGQTSTRADGWFDLAVNGGGQLTWTYEKAGYLPVHRSGDVPWQDWVVAEDVVMIGLDAAVTPIDLASSAPIQVARGSVVTDGDGTRRATLLFSQGTTATANGRPLSALGIRATEYTVGPSGPRAMPAPLPPASGYTYAVELSADEAPGQDVRFSKPVIQYVENFLGFPIGGAVPAGYFDRARSAWMPSKDGRVIKVLDVTGGVAAIDTNGDGIADDAPTLAALGITDAERQQLASLYRAGQGLWRVPVSHFTPWDYNWPYGLPNGSRVPDAQPPRIHEPPKKDCDGAGSIILCQSQVLGEALKVTGTPYRLHYGSDRSPGFRAAFGLDIPVSGASVPNPLRSIVLEVRVAGRRFAVSLPPVAMQSFHYDWDGRDAYGRLVQGAQAATVRIGYEYELVYAATASAFGQSWAVAAGGPMTTPSQRTAVLWQEFRSPIGHLDSRAAGLGGWDLGVHHAYDAPFNVLYKGDGRQDTRAAGRDIRTVLGGSVHTCDFPGATGADSSIGNPTALSFDAAGSLYWADQTGYICRLAPGGSIAPVAGVGLFGFAGDGGPATNATLGKPEGVAAAVDGTLYIADTRNHRVRRVGTNGIITTIAGNSPIVFNGTGGFGGDGGPATQAQLSFPTGVAVAADQSVYILDAGNSRVRKILPGGTIITVAGNGAGGACGGGDGGPATQAALVFFAGTSPPRGPALARDGSLYFSECSRVRRIGPDGILGTVAGGGPAGSLGDGGPAVQAALNDPRGVSVAADGALYLAEAGSSRIRRIGTDGIIVTVAGTGQPGLGGDLGPPGLAAFDHPEAVAVAPDGSLYVADTKNRRIRRVGPVLPGLSPTDLLIASEDGKEIFVFSAAGRHVRTLDSLTGVVRRSFAYDGGGRLASVSDASGNVTTVGRDGAGNPTALVAPGGQRTTLTTSGAGWLSSVTNPAGESTTMTYSLDGLLLQLGYPLGGASIFSYDAAGLLVRDQDPAGGAKTLSRTSNGAGYSVTLSTSSGATATFQRAPLSTGGSRRINSDAQGATTEVVIDPDGARHVTFADGSTVTSTLGPDPRFGMQVPRVVRRVRTLPGGQVETATSQRAVTLIDPKDPTRVQTLDDTVTINGRTFTRSYDATARTITDTSAEGRRMVSTLDALGRVVARSLGAGVAPLAMSWDPKGRLASVQQGTRSWSFAYDAQNRLASRSDAAGRTIALLYDSADRVIQESFPGGGAYRFSYDANGNRTAVTLPGGSSHGFTYNPFGLRASYTPPSGGRFLRTWDLDRRLAQSTLPTGRILARAYDAAGRVSSLASPEVSVAFSYPAGDSTERASALTLTPATGTAQAIAYAYNGNLLSAVTSSGAAPAQVSYTHDNDLFLTGLSLVSGATTVSSALTRDRDGLLTGYGPFAFTRAGPLGALSRAGDGTADTAWGYDSLARLVSRAQVVATRPVYGLQLTYAPDGRISGKSETLAGVTHSFAYAYDLDGQLSEVRRDGSLVEQYAWDVNGNRASRLAGGSSETATYDAQERLAQRGAVAYQFDADGFLASRGTDTFQYGAMGQLLRAKIGGQTITYGYDGLGRRITRTGAAGTTTTWLYADPASPLVSVVIDPAGVSTALYYDTAGYLIALERGGSRYSVATDQVGTPRVVTNSAGAGVKTLEYDSFGNLLADSNPAFELPIGFAGGLVDADTGLVHFGLRDYEPVSGRWTARDPALFAGGQGNLYAYAHNDPVGLRDPSGLFCISASLYDGIGGGASLCITHEGASVCGEVGVGVGGSLGVDNGGLEQSGLDVVADVSVSAGPLEIGVGATVDADGCMSLTPHGQIGPVTFEPGKHGAEIDLGDSELEFGGYGIEAKAAIRVCGQALF